MTTILTKIWDKHAFPDEYPAREQIWAEEAEHRRNEDRRDIYLELSGSGLKINRFTKKRDDGPNGKAARDRAFDDMMLLAVGSPAYMEAYNNELTFTINGEDFEITQGELYERAKQRAEDLQDQIDDARRRGAGAEGIARLQNNLKDVLFVRDTTDPKNDKITEDQHQALQNVLQRTPMLIRSSAPTGNEAAFRRDPGNEKTQAADMSSSMDQDALKNAVIGGWAQDDSRASFAGTVDEEKTNNATTSLSAEFTQAIKNQTTTTIPDEDLNKPVEPQRTTGLDL